jgi:hypothetical protein
MFLQCGITHEMFLLRGVTHGIYQLHTRNVCVGSEKGRSSLRYEAEFSPGRPAFSAGMATTKIAGLT